MKSILGAMVFLTAVANPVADEEKSWFDMQNCDICKQMQPLMSSMHKVKWDSKKIDNGLLSISAFPDDMKELWQKCKADMDATVKKLEGGKKMTCCGFCDSFGSLIASGAKKQEISTTAGDIVMLTSDDPKVVKRIHAHVDKTMAEHKKMEEMMKKMQGSEKK